MGFILPAIYDIYEDDTDAADLTDLIFASQIIKKVIAI